MGYDMIEKEVKEEPTVSTSSLSSSGEPNREEGAKKLVTCREEEEDYVY